MVPERPIEPPIDSDEDDDDGSDRIVRIELLDDDDNVIGVWDRNERVAHEPPFNSLEHVRQIVRRYRLYELGAVEALAYIEDTLDRSYPPTAEREEHHDGDDQ